MAKSNRRLSVLTFLVFTSFALSGLAASAQAATDGTWIQIAPDLNGPIGRTEACTVVDSRRDRLVLFGGYSLEIFLSRTYYTFSTETWALSLAGTPAWSRIAQPDLPGYGRAGAVAVYDSTTDRVWLFGGYHRTSDRYSTSPKLFDAGALVLDFGASGQWVPVTFSGPTPAPREQASLIVDESRRRLLLFGGLDSNGVVLGDLWTMNLDGAPQWTLLSPSGAAPPARYRAAVVCDRNNDRLIIAAGIGAGGLPRSDAWELSLSGSLQWNALAATGAGPSGGVVGAEDRALARMLVVARGDSTTPVWELSQEGAPVWRALAPGGVAPATRDPGFAAAYDPVSTRMPLTWDQGLPYPEGRYPSATFILQFDPPPVVHLAARLDSVVYANGYSALTWHLTADDTLFAPILFERQQGAGWLTVASAFLTPSGDMTLHESVLQPGQRYSYRMEWLSASTMQQTPVFDVDTPPPPESLHVLPAVLSWYDDNLNDQHVLWVAWSVPDDSARWLARIAVERQEDGGAWTMINGGFGPLVTASETNPEIGHLYGFRLAWGPTLSEHAGGDTSFVIPPRPVYLGVRVAYRGHVEADWLYPPDPNLIVTGYATYYPDSIPPHTIPIAPPDTSGVLRLIDLTPLPSGATATYRLGWNIGTGERFTPYEVAYVGDSIPPPPPPPPHHLRVTLDSLVVVDSAVLVRWTLGRDSVDLQSKIAVQSRTDGGAWAVRDSQPAGPWIRYVDASVARGHHYDYRLGWREGFPAVEYTSSDTGLRIPGMAPPGAGLAISAPWPQPASRSLQLAVRLAPDRPVVVSLFDLTGRRVLERTMAGSGDQVMTFDLAGIRSGVYLIRATQGGVTTSRRAVIVR